MKSIPCYHKRHNSFFKSIKLWLLVVAVLVIFSLLGRFPSIAHLLMAIDGDTTKTTIQNLSEVVNEVPSERSNSFNGIPVFYNLYLHPNADENETHRVEALVHEQLSYLIKEIHYPVFIHSIGKELAIPNTILLEHHSQANEDVTLHSLWEYCKNHTDQAVVYLHSKGSFHNNNKNNMLRMFLTRSALSRNCVEALHPSTSNNTSTNNNQQIKCNHCSSRFSPYPHPHTSGNMWMAHCSYVSQLINPLHFEERMAMGISPFLDNVPLGFKPFLFGRGRFAAEHWIASRGAKLWPCDLYNSPKHTFGYKGIPHLKDDPISKTLPPSMFELQPAPRFEWDVYSTNHSTERLTGLEHRWAEYQALYNETPPMFASSSIGDVNTTIGDIWWGWRMKAWVDQAMAWQSPSPSSAMTP